MLDQALVDAGDDDRLIIEIERVPSECVARTSVTTRAAVEHAEAALASAERLGEPAPLASALARLGSTLFYRGQGIRRDLFERAIELEHRAEESTLRTTCASTAMGLLRIENDLDAARPLLERAVARAHGRGEEGGDLIPLLVRLARLEWEAGNPGVSSAGWLRRPRRRASN